LASVRRVATRYGCRIPLCGRAEQPHASPADSLAPPGRSLIPPTASARDHRFARTREPARATSLGRVVKVVKVIAPTIDSSTATGAVARGLSVDSPCRAELSCSVFAGRHTSLALYRVTHDPIRGTRQGTEASFDYLPRCRAWLDCRGPNRIPYRCHGNHCRSPPLVVRGWYLTESVPRFDVTDHNELLAVGNPAVRVRRLLSVCPFTARPLVSRFRPVSSSTFRINCPKAQRDCVGPRVGRGTVCRAVNKLR
jgi:hypothetical protein